MNYNLINEIFKALSLNYNLVKDYKALFPRLQSKKGKLQGFVS